MSETPEKPRELLVLDLVSNQDIANRTGASKSQVGNWAIRYSSFPEPIGIVGGGWTQIWNWPDVEEWIANKFPKGVEKRGKH